MPGGDPVCPPPINLPNGRPRQPLQQRGRSGEAGGGRVRGPAAGVDTSPRSISTCCLASADSTCAASIP
eukprot:245937-Prymnesium_polylepis.1